MNSPSPLRFPKRAGPTIRIVCSCAFLALSGFILYFTIVGLQRGDMYLGAKYGNGHYFHRDRSPVGFWFATVFDFGLFVFLACQSVRELRFTYKHWSEFQNRA
jgi:hypothetical protein